MMTSTINNKKRALFVIGVVAIGLLAAFAQTRASKDYVCTAKHRADSLYREADRFYKENVKPLENQVHRSGNNNVSDEQYQNQLLKDYERLKDDSLKYVKILNNNMPQFQRLEAQIKEETGLEFDKMVREYVDELRNSPCNPQAIEELIACKPFLSDKYLKYFDKSFGPLVNYKKYCKEIKAPLDSIYYDLEFSDWGKPDKEILDRFDHEWKKASYLKLKNDKRIPYLDTIVVQIKNMREIDAFERCEAPFEIILDNLKLQNTPLASRPKAMNDIARYNTSKQLVDEANAKLDEIRPQIDDIWAYFQGVASTKDDLYNLTESWYDIREDLDKQLISMCRYCLSQPCDTMGNYDWLRKQIEPMLDSVFHDSYKVAIKNYKNLLDNYDDYTIEIGEFLKRNFKYTKIDGGLTANQRETILKDFNSLKYMKYYNQRNTPLDKKPVYSPHLNHILDQFMAMVNSGFKSSKEKYKKLGQELRGGSAQDDDVEEVLDKVNQNPMQGHHEDDKNRKAAKQMLNNLGGSSNQ